MDVDKRLSAGADENLLPHADRDQFLTEERRATVRDPDGDLRVDRYVLEKARGADFVITLALTQSLGFW